MKYGYFDVENKEYVITRPDTPLPWINYLGSEEYCGLISNTAGGYSFYKDPRERRLLRYRYNNIPTDRGGRYLYIRDNKSRDFWSASWQPVLKPIKNDPAKGGIKIKNLYEYECRHGLGYTIISSRYSKIKTKTTYFVPRGENLEIWMLEIKNEDKVSRDLTVLSFVEFCLWDALIDITDYQFNLNVGEAEYKDGAIYHLTKYRLHQKDLSYFAALGAKVSSFDTQRENFLGPYGSLDAPLAVREGKCSNSIAYGWEPIGSHAVPLTLKAREEKTLIFILGAADQKKDTQPFLKKYQKKESVQKELVKLKNFWAENLNKFSAETPDPEINLMVNTWNQYQCLTTFNWSRSASYYESGIGRDMGFRDSNQDTLGFVHQIPEKVRERIKDLASNQFKAGNAHHQYSPLTKKGQGGGYSDDHLWLILSTAAYLKETGDFRFLEEQIPFADGESAALYEHLKRALDYTAQNLGPHGLPKMGEADWNDGLNVKGPKGQGESVMVAELLAAAAREMVRLSEIRKQTADCRKYLKMAEEMNQRINKVAWEGNWYTRAFDDDCRPVGSPKNKEGKIHLESQVWAVLSGAADSARARKAMDSVKRYLSTPYGIMLLSPPYTRFYHQIGGVSVYPPGLKENGAIFCHPNPWAVIAECMLGRGNPAYKYYKAILPPAKNEMAQIYRVEPYVYCQMIAGKDASSFGEGKNSWLTGTAAWNFVAVSQWILGIRPDYKGLLVDPCIPKDWKGFTIKRRFRNAVYCITVRNPRGVNKGIKQITLDGKKLTGNLLPVFADGKEHHAEVVMG